MVVFYERPLEERILTSGAGIPRGSLDYSTKSALIGRWVLFKNSSLVVMEDTE